MKRLVKIILSIPVFSLFVLALSNILAGEKQLIDELVVVGLALVWLVYLIKPFKSPKFFLAFLIFIVNVILHNFLSYLLKVEEPVFFSLALLSLLFSVILLLLFVFNKLKELIKKVKKKC